MLLYTFGCMNTELKKLFFRKDIDQTQMLSTLTFHLCAPENVGRLVTPAKKLEDTIRLAELVIEVLVQNEEHHAEVSVSADIHAPHSYTRTLTHRHTARTMAVYAKSAISILKR